MLHEYDIPEKKQNKTLNQVFQKSRTVDGSSNKNNKLF